MGKGFWILLVIAAAFLVTGCGSASNGDGTATATVSKAKFDKRMEALCERSEEEKFEQIGIAARDGMWPRHREPTPGQLEKITSAVVVPVFRHMTEEMRGMPLPSGSEKRAKAMVSTFEGDVREMEREPSRFVEGIAFEDGNNAAGTMDLTQCSF